MEKIKIVHSLASLRDTLLTLFVYVHLSYKSVHTHTQFLQNCIVILNSSQYICVVSNTTTHQYPVPLSFHAHHLTYFSVLWDWMWPLTSAKKRWVEVTHVTLRWKHLNCSFSAVTWRYHKMEIYWSAKTTHGVKLPLWVIYMALGIRQKTLGLLLQHNLVYSDLYNLQCCSDIKYFSTKSLKGWITFHHHLFRQSLLIDI